MTNSKKKKRITINQFCRAIIGFLKNTNVQFHTHQLKPGVHSELPFATFTLQHQVKIKRNGLKELDYLYQNIFRATKKRAIRIKTC